MRPRVLRRRLVLAGFGAILAGALLGTGVGKALMLDPPGIGCAAGITIEWAVQP